MEFVNLMVDYFNHLNKPVPDEEESKTKEDAIKKRELRMAAFCDQNMLQLKSIKEVHALCLQL